MAALGGVDMYGRRGLGEGGIAGGVFLVSVAYGCWWKEVRKGGLRRVEVFEEGFVVSWTKE